MFFEQAAAFRAWLECNAEQASQLLVGYWKVASGRPSMSWPDSVDEALCFGWIDGVRKRIDDTSYQIRFTPRKSSSIWSAVNIRKYAALDASGRMTEAGRRAYMLRTDAKSEVYAYEQAAIATLSAVEILEFRRDPSAWAYFEACPPSYRKVVLHWITGAKRVETRATRLRQLIEACIKGERLR